MIETALTALKKWMPLGSQWLVLRNHVHNNTESLQYLVLFVKGRRRAFCRVVLVLETISVSLSLGFEEGHIKARPSSNHQVTCCITTIQQQLLHKR